MRSTARSTGGESIQRETLVERRTPRSVEVRREARKGFGDRSVDGDRFRQQVQVSHERIESPWQRVARRAAVGARRHLDREQPIGVGGSGVTLGGLDRAWEPDARAVGRGGRRPAREVAGCAPREASEPRGRGRRVGGQDRWRPDVERSQEQLEPLPDPDEGEHRALARRRQAPPEIARRDGRQARALDQEAFRLRHRRGLQHGGDHVVHRREQIGIVCKRTRQRRAAGARAMPLAMSRAVATSSRVLGDLGEPAVAQLPERGSSSLTSVAAVGLLHAAFVRDDLASRARAAESRTRSRRSAGAWRASGPSGTCW